MCLRAPDWIEHWLGEADAQHREGQGWHGVLRRGTRFAHLRIRVVGAATLQEERLSDATRSAYAGVRAALDGAAPIRFWNFLPGILGAASRQRDRYMVFNTGRYQAFDDWFGELDPQAFAAAMPAATGVGIAGPDLYIDCLADRVPGVALENPRQRAAHRYSERYGPRPPCFSRATCVQAPSNGALRGERAPSETQGRSAGRSLLISGTASILGEDSVHVGQPLDQLDETLANLQAVIETAGGTGLQDLVSARLYYRDEALAEPLRRSFARQVSVPVEFCRATLCRPELDVEVEAVAHFV